MKHAGFPSCSFPTWLLFPYSTIVIFWPQGSENVLMKISVSPSFTLERAWQSISWLVWNRLFAATSNISWSTTRHWWHVINLNTYLVPHLRRKWMIVTRTSSTPKRKTCWGPLASSSAMWIFMVLPTVFPKEIEADSGSKFAYQLWLLQDLKSLITYYYHDIPKLNQLKMNRKVVNGKVGDYKECFFVKANSMKTYGSHVSVLGWHS